MELEVEGGLGGRKGRKPTQPKHLTSAVSTEFDFVILPKHCPPEKRYEVPIDAMKSSTPEEDEETTTMEENRVSCNGSAAADEIDVDHSPPESVQVISGYGYGPSPQIPVPGPSCPQNGSPVGVAADLMRYVFQSLVQSASNNPAPSGKAAEFSSPYKRKPGRKRKLAMKEGIEFEPQPNKRNQTPEVKASDEVEVEKLHRTRSSVSNTPRVKYDKMFQDFEYDIPGENENCKKSKSETETKRRPKPKPKFYKLPALADHQAAVEMKLASTDPDLDADELRSCWIRTFRERRKWIQNEQPYTHEILRVYPALTLPEMLEWEFHNISGAHLCDIQAKLQPRLDAYFENEGKTKQLREMFPLCQRSYDCLQNTGLGRDTQEYSALRNCVGLLFLWHELDAKINYGDLYRFRDLENDTENEICEKFTKSGQRRAPGHPYIIIVSGKLIDGVDKMNRMAVIAEHHEITRSDNFYNSMMLIYLTYGVFLFQYDKNVQKLFTYFDELLAVQLPFAKFVV